MRSNRCGRLDAHEPHTWHGRRHVLAVPRIPRNCPGRTVVEGGHRGAR